jgi:hypothetical protein
MTYPQCSDCDAQWIYGDGSLWLYDTYNGSLSRPHGELLRVTPCARAPVPVFKIPSGRALWLVAAGHTVWLEADGERSRSTLWRLQGPDATPTAPGRYPANSDQGADIGEAPPTHAGNAAIGIYYVASPRLARAWRATSRCS